MKKLTRLLTRRHSPFYSDLDSCKESPEEYSFTFEMPKRKTISKDLVEIFGTDWYPDSVSARICYVKIAVDSNNQCPNRTVYFTTLLTLKVTLAALFCNFCSLNSASQKKTPHFTAAVRTYNGVTYQNKCILFTKLFAVNFFANLISIIIQRQMLVNFYPDSFTLLNFFNLFISMKTFA